MPPQDANPTPSFGGFGLKQRIHVLNTFINDIYHDQRIVKDGIVPEHMIQSARNLLPACMGLNPPKGLWCHITGTDLVRDGSGEMFVLEDNLRCPSGVSYVLENRQVLKGTFPEVFEASRVRPVDDYPSRLLETLRYLVSDDVSTPVVVLLTPGVYNSAYFEHAFLAQQMGIELVEGRDLTRIHRRTGMDGVRTAEGGEGVTGAMIRARTWVDGRLASGLQALLGAPMAAYSGCGEPDGGIGHGKRRSRTGLARVCGDVGLAGGSVADGRRQAGSGMARSRARARLNCSSQGQRRGRCRVNRRAERVIRPTKAKTRRLRVLVVTIC